MKNSKQIGKTEQKTKFIELRASGKSYAQIAKELQVSKATLTTWNTELSDKITHLKSITLQELYQKYCMLKESRIRQFGDTLGRINKEIEAKDFAEMSLDKLLDFKIKFTKELKEEFVELPEDKTSTKINTQTIMNELAYVLHRLRLGEVGLDQAAKENIFLINILKSYEQNVLETRINTLEDLVKK